MLHNTSRSSSFSPSDFDEPSSSAPTVGSSSPAPAPNSASITGEHVPDALVSPHNPFVHHGFNYERAMEQVVEKILKRMEELFTDFQHRITQDLDEHKVSTEG